MHVPLIVHWPAGVTDRGGLRDEFHHVSDIVPTIYDVVGVEAPEVYRGLDQMPITGTSMALHRSTGRRAQPQPTKAVQYFEMMGHRALYADGWKAVTRHQLGVQLRRRRWELYHVAEDRSECHDLATEEPERLAALVDRWWARGRGARGPAPR